MIELAPFLRAQQKPAQPAVDPFPPLDEEPAAPAAPLLTPLGSRAIHRTADEVPLPEGLRLERNLAVLAGAGAGKTYSLVTMCLHLLSGARAGHEPIECAQLGLLTFTDKAASEMRGRLRERLDALADGRGEEPDLRASFEVLGRPFPPPHAWRALRDELGAASIGTFHSLCTQLLRRAPPGSRVNPNFELLDERDARALVRETIERVILDRVQASDAAVRQLVSELGFGGGTGGGLVDALVPTYQRIREEGVAPEYVQVADAAELRAQFDRKFQRLRRETREALNGTPRNRDRLQNFHAILQSTTFETFPEQLARLRNEIGNLRTEPFTSLKRFVRKYDRNATEDPEDNLGLLYGACVMAPHEAAVRELLTEIAQKHQRALEERGVLDFTGMLVQARDLLRDSPDARREAQARFRALLVDEFQDTNRLQFELVMLLAEKRESAPRPVSSAFEQQHVEIAALPIEPAFLAVVGDRKQAIYEFRGADVSVFEAMARCIERCGGGRAYLRASRRSSPTLLALLNRVNLRVLGREKYAGDLMDFEVVYQPEHDDLEAVRTRETDAKPLVVLTRAETEAQARETADELRAADADGVGRYLAQLLGRREFQVVPKKDELPLRPIRGGDVAVLFQRFTQLEVYRQALVRHGVRHRVVRGRGFFGAQEIVDVASLLSLIADPDDAISLAAVLRSPMVGLSDSSLVELSLRVGGGREDQPGLRPRQVLQQGRVPPGASPQELARLERFVRSWTSLRRERDRLGLRALLRVALDGLAYRVAVASAPFGEQALANLDKLLELATSRERAGVSVAAFARELLELADTEPTEAQGEIVDELDSDAVTLCTVHQAKGLEWPIVVLPDLAATLNNSTGSVRFDRDRGLGVRAFGDDPDLQSLNTTRINELRNRRARAENLRLLYVALTRARDRVVLGLLPAKPRTNTWAEHLKNGVTAWKDVRDVTEEIDVATLAVGSAPIDELAPAESARAEVQALLRRVREAPPAKAKRAVLPVTQLEDFVTCPRRFYFAHQVGLPEQGHTDSSQSEAPHSSQSEAPHSSQSEAPHSSLSEAPHSSQSEAPHSSLSGVEGPALTDASDSSTRDRGTAAHRILELTPLDTVNTPALSETLALIRRTEGLEDVAGEDVLHWVAAFWKTRLGAQLAALGEERVHRELPFVLTLADGDGFRLSLRGVIDLVVEADGTLLVIDYKTSLQPEDGLEQYRFQLGCYALAAKRFAGHDVPVRAGIVFLREDDREPRWLDALPDATTLERELVQAARNLTRSQVSGDWTGQPRSKCESLGCGFVYRCHGSP